MWLKTIGFSFLICTRWLAFSQVPLEKEPPLGLLQLILKTKLDFCGNNTRMLFVFHHGMKSGYHNFPYLLITLIGEPYILMNNLRLIEDKQLPVDCGIFFVHKREISFPSLKFRRKLIILEEDSRTNQLKPSRIENDLDFDSINVEFTPPEVKPLATSNRRSKFVKHDLHQLDVLFYYCPIEESKSVMIHFWKTFADRHNLTVRRPMMLPNFEALIRLPIDLFSLHRVRYAECFMVPIGRQRPLELILIDPFDIPGWICILLTICFVLLLFWVTGDRSSTLGRLIFEMVRTVLSGPHDEPSTAFERQTITVFVIGNLILITSYQSLITAAITQPSFYPALNTLDKINGSCLVDSRVQFGRSPYTFQRPDEAVVLQKYLEPTCLQTTCYVFQVFNTMCEYLKRSNISCHTYRKSRIEVLLLPILGAMSSPWNSVTELVRFYADAFAEGGLYHSVDGLPEDSGEATDEESLVRPLVFGDLDLVWRIMMHGWILCGVAFVGEIVFYQFKRWLSKRVIRLDRVDA